MSSKGFVPFAPPAADNHLGPRFGVHETQPLVSKADGRPCPRDDVPRRRDLGSSQTRQNALFTAQWGQLAVHGVSVSGWEQLDCSQGVVAVKSSCQ